ncbi:Multifunctional conjugation protein TraI (plasmid) [Corynebacterium atrinae]|uniref:MobF family relaxase n=1 Tax=Corynebacterium atrinae TaxID=1336740 RepID=UPI0025B4EA38|nr:MobF family relaxase [Corynebacterium atrinae]WJY64677.1 Multifunctional conjugation protein TraI [Corynebacterium atrinae]
MLTIARMHSESVAYYESTVETGPELGPDGYYSEDGTRPASAWVVARTGQQQAEVAEFLGTEPGAVVEGEVVQRWFNRAVAPSGNKLGRRPGASGVPGFDLTFCAPKSVSLVWGLSQDPATKKIVDQAHAQAVATALEYLSEHAGYTRKASDWDASEMVIDRVEALSGVRYEHRTSRAGDPHVHSHVLVSNRQLCADGKVRSLDSKSLFHEARAAGMLYQSVLRSTLSETLGVEWSETVNGCAEIAGLEDREVLTEYSTRMREIDLWKAENGVGESADFSRMGQKITRRIKDTDTTLTELEQRWQEQESAARIRAIIADFQPHPETETPSSVMVPTAAKVTAAVIAERSTFTRADLVEKAAEMMPVGAVSTAQIHTTIEAIVDEIIDSGTAWSVNPDAARSYTLTAREGSQRFTAEPVVEEINHGIDLATAVADRGVTAWVASTIRPVDGELSEDQAAAMRQVVTSRYRASVVVAPAGAGKTSSLKAARKVWERSGKTVVGLAPTGKAADVMVREDVAHSSATIARTLMGTKDLTPDQIAGRLGWDRDTVVVVDEAGMVATPDVVTLLEVATAADARVVLVGDPHQYAAVKARSGMLATLAYELPDAVELAEVFRQKDPGERRASQQLRNGDDTDTARAAQWYADKGRLHAGSFLAMVSDVTNGWLADLEAGRDCLLVASTREDVAVLNSCVQNAYLAFHGHDTDGPSVALAGEARAHVGDMVLTRRNDYQLVTSAGDVVRNGQRWHVQEVREDGSVSVRRLDDTGATATLPAGYAREHVQLGYASTGHAAQGVTVDVCRVMAGVGQVDRAGVYVPLTRGRDSNHLYLVDNAPGDPDTSHVRLTSKERRETTEYAKDLLIQAAGRDRADVAPHQVWRAAKRDFELARLSSNQRIDHTPFTGTRMAEVMAERHTRRRKRLDDFYRHQGSRLRPPAPSATPAAIVEQSLATRPLADVSDELLARMVTDPQGLRETHAQAVGRYEDLSTRRQQAQQAQERFADLIVQRDHVQEQLGDLRDQRADVQKVVDGLRARTGLSRLLRDRGQEDQTREQLRVLSDRIQETNTASIQLSHEIQACHEQTLHAPTDQEMTQAQDQVEELAGVVEVLDDREAITAEATWRQDATGEVTRADRNRRRAPADENPVAGDLTAEITGGSAAAFVESFTSGGWRSTAPTTEQGWHQDTWRNQGFEL